MENVDFKKSIAEAKSVVFRCLKYRPRSVQEIQKKLRDKDFSAEIVQQTIEYFQKIGSLNDRLFAGGWVRSRLNKPLGSRRIRQELKLKGVADDLITRAFEIATPEYDEDAAIMALAKRRMRQYAHLEQRAAKRRLYGYLARRGFNAGAIVKVLKNIFDQ